MDNIYKIFDDYVLKNFDINNKYIKLKFDHTYRVVEYAKKIAIDEKLNEYDRNLAIICALFHDIARFKQISLFNTFDDQDSFDHGDEGYNILIDNNFINKFSLNEEDKAVVLKAVKNHNKLKLENNLSQRQILFCNLVRDADKLDIINTCVNDIYDNSCTINDKILKEIKSYRLCSNEYTINCCENVIRYLAFIYDFNFKKSFEIIKNSNTIDKKIDLLKQNVSDINLDEIKELLVNFVDNKIKIYNDIK